MTTEKTMGGTMFLFTNFIAICLIFSISGYLLVFDDFGSLWTASLGFAAVLLTAIELSKYICTRYWDIANPVIARMATNACGIIVGMSVMILLGVVLPTLNTMTGAVIFSSVMTFFVLGTLSSILKSDKEYTR